MTFLNTALLPGLLLLTGLPLLIHLLNLKFPQLFHFSSIKRIRETAAQRSRIFRWRHLILLALRTAFLLALLLAFLKPVAPRFGAAAGQSAGRVVLLVIDQSLSMEHKRGGLTGRQRAESEAEKIFATLGPDDLVNVMLAGTAPQTCFVEFSRSHADARRFVQKMKPAFARADFTLATAAAARLLAPHAARAEIYYLSDFQRKNWASVDFTPLPPASRVFFVDVAEASRENRAIVGATLGQAQILAGDTVLLEVEVGNFRDEPLREPLRVMLDARVTFDKEASVPPWSVGKVTIPVPPGGPGLHLCEISFAPDELPHDDRFFLTIPVLEKESILIVSDAADPAREGVRFLETALNPYENRGGSLLPERTTAAGLSTARTAGVKKVFLTRSGRLDPAGAKALADFVFHGGGVVYFLDGEYDAQNLAAIERAVAAPLPLKLGRKRVAQNVGTGAQQISRGEFKSRFLRLFRGTLRQNLALLEFYDLHEATATGAGQILLNYADDTPAMASLEHGLGTLLLMNFSVSEFSSNLARQRIFPAWMQDLVKTLANDDPVPAATTIGGSIEAEVWQRDLADTPVRKPSGDALEVKAQPLGERAAIAIAPDEPGFYTLRKGARLLHAWAANPDPDESDLRAIDRAHLPEQLGTKGQRGFFVSGQEEFAEAARGRPLFHWFVFAGIALLAAESVFQLVAKRHASGAARLPR